MFTATGEEMRQTEQPVECFIERTKHKRKKCTRCFSSEAALKQHHCEPQIKKKKCPHCTETINRANDLVKHWEIVRRLLHTLANTNYVKWLLMDPLHWRMDTQHLRNWWWRKCRWAVHMLKTLNIGRPLK